MKNFTYTLKMIPLFLIFIFSLTQLHAAEKLRVAVLNFQPGDVDTSIYAAKAVTQIITAELQSKPEFTVITGKQADIKPDEPGSQNTGCVETDCAVNAGKLIGADKVITGTVSFSLTGNWQVITAKVIDVKSGNIETTEKERCADEDDLKNASKIIAVKITKKISGASYKMPERTYETGNSYFITTAYRFGILYGTDFPSIDFNENTNTTRGIKTKKTNLLTQSIVVSPGYKFNDNFSLKADLKYTFSISNKNTDEWHYNEFYSTEYGGVVEYYPQLEQSEKNLGRGYGISLNPVFNFPFRVCSFFISPGIGLDHYHIKNLDARLINSYCAVDLGFDRYSVYYINTKSETYSPYIKLEFGISINIFEDVDLYASTGIDFHFLCKFYSDVEIKEKRSDSMGAVPPVYQTDDFSNKYKGNTPPEIYSQAGLLFRVF